MSILINGIKMPKRGESCLVITIMPDGEIYKNVYDASLRVNQVGEAVPVPAHGRLIDADKIEYVQSENGCLDDYAYRYDINEMPTIVPAEEGE